MVRGPVEIAEDQGFHLLLFVEFLDDALRPSANAASDVTIRYGRMTSGQNESAHFR
jgi:hypothetical protein